MIKNSENKQFINGEIYGGLVGWLGQGLVAGLETLAGYGIGYLTGKIVKLFS